MKTASWSRPLDRTVTVKIPVHARIRHPEGREQRDGHNRRNVPGEQFLAAVRLHGQRNVFGRAAKHRICDRIGKADAECADLTVASWDRSYKSPAASLCSLGVGWEPPRRFVVATRLAQRRRSS